MTSQQKSPRPGLISRRLLFPPAAPRGQPHRTRLPARTLITLLTLSFVLIFSSIPLAEAKDPVADFCRRWGHQTAVVDERLFVDGGYVNWEPIGPNPTNFTNEWFLYHDLSSNAADGLPPLINLFKNSTVPDVTGGALWADTVNKRVYQFGGEVDLLRQAPPTGYVLYAYDALYDRWETMGRPDVPLNSPSYGGSVAVSERGLGFYYGGWLSNATVPGWTGPPVATDSLVVYDMDMNEFRNKSGPSDNIARAEGAMVYIPAGDDGLLVYLGGVQDRHANGTLDPQPMTEILLYDFTTEKWYQQTATGNVPDNRRRFCAGAAWAPDYSSYNIYLYGGISIPPNGTSFDDVWILTMPTFQWLKWYPEPDAGVNGEFPHHSLSCNVVGDGSQMIIIGGSFPMSEACDSSPQYGAHNLDLGQQNPDKRKWITYNTTLKGYQVPEDIYNLVGGNAMGGATATTPAGGFDAQDVGVLMTRVASASTRTPTRDVTPSGSGLSKGAIAGIVVGGVAVLIAGCVLGFFCIRRRQRAHFEKPRSTRTDLGHDDQMWLPTGTISHSHSPTTPQQYFNTHNGLPTAGSYGAPAELPGAGSVNVGAWESTNSPSVIQSPDGKTDYVLVPVPVHLPSHSSSGSYTRSPNSGYGVSLFGPAGGYAPVAQGSPVGSPTRLTHGRPITPQELSTEPRDPNEGPRKDGPIHLTYYHPTQA